MIKILPTIISCFLPILLLSQDIANKKTLSHDELVNWNKIIRPQISNDGNWVVYTLKGEEGDPQVQIYNGQKNTSTSFDRSDRPQITEDSRFVLFSILPAQDSIKELRRKKIDKKDLPKKHLGIYDLQEERLDTIFEVMSYKVPKDWSGSLVYLKEFQKGEKTKILTQDSRERKERKKVKNQNPKTGSVLTIRDLNTQDEQSFPFVIDYELADEAAKIAYVTTGNDSTVQAGVYIYDGVTKRAASIWEQKGTYKNLAFDEQGKQLAFHANFDTTGAQIPPFELLYWKAGQSKATSIASNQSSFLSNNWIISEHKKPSFSKDGTKMQWGIAPPPILQDTSLLEEEIVNVEVWHWEDAKLHPQQKVELSREEKRAYTMIYHTATNAFTHIGSLDMPIVRNNEDRNANYLLGYNELPYYKSTSWEGGPTKKDVFLVNSQTGAKKQIATAVQGSVNLSPAGHFAFSYVAPDSAWYAYNVRTGKVVQMTDNEKYPFYNEKNDVPAYPRAAGYATWTEKDRYILIYDRYDIWKVDPTGKETPERLTEGREKQQRYRYNRLDREKYHVKSGEKLLLTVFDERTKESGYTWLNWETGIMVAPQLTPHSYARRPIKAKYADKLLFTKEDFRTFPDLIYSDLDLSNTKKISEANPQQSEFNWGSAELYTWTSLGGKDMEGLLIKPDNFDPTKKYPMIVNFYEQSSDGLYRHRAPFPHRSTINYSFYVSKGYVIFNPNITYTDGYPGQSCYDAVVSGVTAILKDGFIDKERIGIQGHSWGGYQIAYLLNKTDLFTCAESGAPVVNMFSAYGGIRWGSGRSRMFQYEKTQSRIGGTIWEYPLRYIENSPLFELDKTNTPVLILHNDKDGAVPWYQGIEYFTALRRLGKPAWLLNYNGEPHWPLKLQNRKDFNIRMQQFFDYYLKDAAMPSWMEKGVSAMEKGKRQGLELEKRQ